MFKLTLRTRIYFSMLALILISFLITGFTAYYFFKKENDQYNQQRLERKESAVRKSMDYFLASRGGFIHPDSVASAFSDKICELSDVHKMDILMFDLRGNLIISAIRPDTTVAGVSADIAYETEEEIDYAVYKKLLNGSPRAETEKLHLGKPHILTYWYFQDYGDKPISITGVRYNKKEVMKEDLNTFLVQLTAIYIPLFFGASIVAFFISNYITKSLQRIGKRMQDVSVQEINEPIEWDSDDEIGRLVSEYNRMLKEVEKSAEQLAKSERESAWREMAKQVAHEIKNPLTPMKLRIQHLSRAWDDEATNFDEKFRETSHVLIEQIDTLTNIANEFSNFAKMPKAERSAQDLKETIEAVVDLFSANDEVDITFTSEGVEKAPVFADKEQLSRVFNNLITNAIQAIPEDRRGKVMITLKEYNEMYICEVADNGTGIEENQRDKIFVPNFTTKSTGAGLGLAMVRNIIDHHGGEIWFQTEIGVGTQFFFKIPKSS